MVDSALITWSDTEQVIAEEAFSCAYGRAVQSVISTVRREADSINNAEALWRLHDYLSTQRHVMEGRFDFRLDGILFVFASLVKENLLDLQELDGLDADKIAKIKAMSRF
ncbi:hypothetical protein I1E95_08945 [Synechococcus sp. CBW1107]|jgi:hypothetical protein|uniref:hypothetical protein n=1 Tax=Synechococcus sp. CBW1107 TaxID=2789857 RepID=UPI0018CED0D7|nr:hypothetical protein [Synechococcus sp. CBW1107]QPN55368.1 hypothetical protein I1E95_08945 [Synechococcus sp. CBW1107]CAK6689266.1 Fluorescence recovery protein [Synechococcus sp. CBW1107]